MKPETGDDDCLISEDMTSLWHGPETIEAIRKIEKLSQMQFCGAGYLDYGHSIYAPYDLDELGGKMSHGQYTDFSTLPNYLAKLNTCHLDTIANALLENSAITQADRDAAIAYYGR